MPESGMQNKLNKLQGIYMRSSSICLTALFFLLLPSSAFPWGSLYPGETHQYIIATAFKRLKSDPAFAPQLFPTFSTLKQHEGVQWTANGLFGVGPDGEGMSTYSEHYYNPVTREGNGPTAAARYFTYLARENISAKPGSEAGAKAAAFSAHFLADMFVPFHVVGTSRSNATRIWTEQNLKHRGVINLGRSITGSQKLAYWTPFKGGNENYHTELSRFINKTDPTEVDWFDPWYYNGNTETMMIKTSSHVAWEAIANGTPVIEIHKRSDQGTPGYDPQWSNTHLTGFGELPINAQADQVRKLAILSATDTRTNLDSIFEDPTTSLSNAIRAVYTIWRASFSGLRPEIIFEPDGPNAYKVTGRVGNYANANASSVRTRLTSVDCTVAGPNEKTVGALHSRRRKDTTPWRVMTSNRLCRLKLEVMGDYPIPDLQYSFAERSFFPQQTDERPEPKKPEQVTVPPSVKKNDTLVKGRWSCSSRSCICLYPPEPWRSGCSPEQKANKYKMCRDDGEYCGSMPVENANRIWEQKKAGTYQPPR